MPHQDEDSWDLNSPARVRDALAHQPASASQPQAESAVHTGARAASVPTTPDRPDGPLPYA